MEEEKYVQVIVEYIDDTSISPEEVREHAKALYGVSAKIKIAADSDDSFNLMYFAVQQHITMRQVHSFYDDGVLYPEKLKQLRKEVLGIVDDALGQVISDNEEKLS